MQRLLNLVPTFLPPKFVVDLFGRVGYGRVLSVSLGGEVSPFSLRWKPGE